MEIVFIKLRLSILVLVICNTINEMGSRQICMTQVIVAPIGLIMTLAYFTTMFISLMFGAEFEKVILCYFDIAGTFAFIFTTWIIATHKAFEFRTFQDPVVLNAFLPLCVAALMFADFLLTLTYGKEEPDYDDVEA